MYAYDIQFYLCYLISKEKLLTSDEFNTRLQKVSLSDRDSKNRPRSYKTRGKNSKYEGNAGSLRVLSRILTTLLTEELEQSKVMDHIIKLQEVAELVCAPLLDRVEIMSTMKYGIIEYLELRRQAVHELGMENMKPKHHYLGHYWMFFMMYGPLIFIWAIRLEAKHTFFKNVVRTAKNFINVPKTCSNRHQMAQISYFYNGLFPKKVVIVSKEAPSKLDILKGISDTYLRDFVERFESYDIFPSKIEVYGTLYKPGMILVLKKAEYQEKLLIGMLRHIGVENDNVFFGCDIFTAVRSKYGYYVSDSNPKKSIVINHSNLADCIPLKRIGPLNSFSFSLHHFVSSSSLSSLYGMNNNDIN